MSVVFSAMSKGGFMYKVRTVLLVLVTCSFGSYADPVLGQFEFDAAREQSDKDKENNVAAGGSYMVSEFDPFYEDQFPQLMRTCFRSVSEPETKSFEVVLSLDAEGNVQNLWLNLSTDLSKCASEAIGKLNFPQPPFSPYHARITTNLE
jgi:hypothetical protein